LNTTYRDNDLIKLLKSDVELEISKAELSMKFHQTLKGLLSPDKILRLYQAENQYRQQLLRQLQERNQPRDNPGRPGPPPPGNQ
jgi:hypothetical protein